MFLVSARQIHLNRIFFKNHLPSQEGRERTLIHEFDFQKFHWQKVCKLWRLQVIDYGNFQDLGCICIVPYAFPFVTLKAILFALQCDFHYHSTTLVCHTPATSHEQDQEKDPDINTSQYDSNLVYCKHFHLLVAKDQ